MRIHRLGLAKGRASIPLRAQGSAFVGGTKLRAPLSWWDGQALLQPQNGAGWVGSARTDAPEEWANPGVGDAQGHHYAQKLSSPKKES